MRAPLLIVGAGRLGQRVGRRWGGSVTAETLTDRSHSQIILEGMKPRVRSHEGKFENIVFAVPPFEPKEKYYEEVERALLLWKGTGNFVFISSTAVYGEENGGFVSEDSALGDSNRARRLIRAEISVLRKKGIILRLAGLYDKDSGPHRHYLAQETSPLRGDGWVNLIHYDDAAVLCLKALEKLEPAKIYLGSDGVPIMREELCLLAGILSGSRKICRFLGTEGPLGRKCSNAFTRYELEWTPHWESFARFVQRSLS